MYATTRPDYRPSNSYSVTKGIQQTSIFKNNLNKYTADLNNQRYISENKKLKQYSGIIALQQNLEFKVF